MRYFKELDWSGTARERVPKTHATRAVKGFMTALSDTNVSMELLQGNIMLSILRKISQSIRERLFD